LPETTATAVAALKMPGLGFQNEPKRLYPNDAIGAAVLGFVNDNGDGVTGVEGYYDAALRGTDGRLVVERDPANRDLAVGLREAVAPRNGADLTLTIDLVAQNAGAAWVGQKVGAQRLADYFARFGFGKPTGVDLAGEVSGTVRPLAEWYPVDVGTASFGQGVSVSPLQLAMAYAALANGGTLYRPYVVASRRDADGAHRTAPVPTRQVGTPETAATLRGMLLYRVDDGIAHTAATPVFSVAGKTG